MAQGFHQCHHPLNHVVSGWAISEVLVVYMHVVLHPSTRKMRETRAIFRPYGIYATHIGLHIKELAWLLHIHPVARSVFVQVLFLELIHRQANVRGDPGQVFRRIGWAHCFTAVGAAQAIRLFPNFFVYNNSQLVKAFGGIIAEPG